MPATKKRPSPPASQRYPSATKAERTARTAEAVKAATERRRKAHKVLDALESAGIEVNVEPDEVSS